MRRVVSKGQVNGAWYEDQLSVDVLCLEHGDEDAVRMTSTHIKHKLIIQTYRRRLVIISLPLHFGLQLTREDRSLNGYQDGRSPIGRRLHNNVTLFVQFRRWNTPGTRLECSAPVSHQMKECVECQGSEQGQARHSRGQVRRRQRAPTAHPQFVPHKLAEFPVGQSSQSVVDAPGTTNV